MSKILAVIAAAVLSLGAVTFAAAPANASVCDDGWKLLGAYAEMGDNATYWALYLNMMDMGC